MERNIVNLFASAFDIGSSHYNYSIEICALFFLSVFMVKFFATKKFSSKLNRIFAASLILAWIDIFCDIIGTIFIDLMMENPSTNAYDIASILTNSGFYVFQVSFPALFSVFLIYLAGDDFKNHRWMNFLYTPYCIFVIIILLNPLTKWIVFCDSQVNAAGELVKVYAHGPVFPVFYVMVFFYFILAAIVTIKYRKQLTRRNIFTVIMIMIFLAILLGIQMVFPNLLLTGAGITIAIYLFMSSLANPDELIDNISGLYNYEALDHFLTNDKKTNDRTYYIVIEIHNSDEINAMFGIITGNKLYEMIGKFLLQIKGKNGWAFRMFGGRFVLAYKNKDDQIKAVEDINKKFKMAWDVNDINITLSASIYYFSKHTAMVYDSFVDFLTYIEQEKGKTNEEPVLVDKEEYDKIIRRQNIIKILERVFANNNGELSMNYQPIYDVKLQKFTHSEALIRLIDPELGYIPPDEFIPIAEAIGYAQKIDDFALESACKVLHDSPEIHQISVNVSCAEFFDNPSSRFLEIVSKYNVDPSRISFEITETAAITYPEKIQHFMRMMVTAGFSFFLDDFGTGYSNIVQVLDKPFACIKLDKTFLKEDALVDQVLKGVVKLFKDINKPITIEGVETKEQLDYVSDVLKVDYIQGYYFSRPLNSKDFIAFVKRNNE